MCFKGIWYSSKKKVRTHNLTLSHAKFIASIVSLFLFGMKKLEESVGEARCEGILYASKKN